MPILFYYTNSSYSGSIQSIHKIPSESVLILKIFQIQNSVFPHEHIPHDSKVSEKSQSECHIILNTNIIKHLLAPLDRPMGSQADHEDISDSKPNLNNEER
jgi:hypothetical protein